MEQKKVVLVGENQASLLNVCWQYSRIFYTTFTSIQKADWSSHYYSWNGMFANADLIVNCGGWDLSYVQGIQRKAVPVITWSGDDLETVQRILRILQSE
jgi:hypothetical protein